MSALQHPDAMGAPDLQIWNNAAFDDGSDGGGSAGLKEPSPAWYPLRTIPAVRAPESLFHGAGKENRGVGLPRPSPVPKKTPPGKTCPLTPITVKQPASARNALGSARDDDRVADVGDIDEEIQRVEKEIGRLTLRLETLHLQKAERDSRTTGRRGRIVPAKFLDPKTSSDKNDQVGAPATRKVQESPATAKVGRRGASLGPLEISTGIGLQQPGMPGIAPARSDQGRRKSLIQKLQDVAEEVGEGDKKEREKPLGSKQGTPDIRSQRTTDSRAAVPTSVEFRRRGASLGPSEIAAVVGSCRLGKKLQEIKEEETEPKKGSRRSLSSSPKFRQPAAKLPDLRKGIATVDSKKPARRENPVQKNLPPKTLFREAKKSVKKEQTAPLKSLKRGILTQEVKKPAAVKRPGKNVKMRTVASRYSLITVRVGRNAQEGKRRKWSLPDSGKDDEEATDVKKSRMSMPLAGQTLATENQGRLQWGIPDQIDEEADAIEGSPSSIMRIARSLPKIRTVRCDTESPRDSGRAKRVAELVGRESHFSAVVEDEGEGTASASCESMDLGEDEQ